MGRFCDYIRAEHLMLFSFQTFIGKNLNPYLQAGSRTGDRVWKMPLFKLYSKQIKEAGHLADVNNISGSKFAGSCTAAAFLKVIIVDLIKSASVTPSHQSRQVNVLFAIYTIFKLLKACQSVVKATNVKKNLKLHKALQLELLFPLFELINNCNFNGLATRSKHEGDIVLLGF